MRITTDTKTGRHYAGSTLPQGAVLLEVIMEDNSSMNNINWISVDDKVKPKVGQVVLALAPSGYIRFPWMIFAATYDPDYKGWATVQNNRITDCCPEDVKYWAEMIETP